MTKCIQVDNGIITLCETDFKCPRCGYIYHEEDYYSQLDKSKRGLIYKSCKGCKTKIGITTDIRGDVRVWEKSEESKFNKVKPTCMSSEDYYNRDKLFERKQVKDK